MELDLKRHPPETTVIAIAGEMDMYNSHELKQVVADLFANGRGPLILDFSELKYIDSSGVSVLIFVFTQARKAGIGLWYANVHGTVRKVIELTSLLNFFPIVDSVETALKLAAES